MIGLVGARGAVGKEVAALLAEGKWRPALKLYGTKASQGEKLDLGERSWVINPIDEVSDIDLLINATPQPMERPAAYITYAEEIDLPLSVPWVNPEIFADKQQTKLAIPSAGGLLLSAVIGVLWRLSFIESYQASVFLSASAMAGKSGMDELSSQVIGLFTQSSPTLRHFPKGLAFDLLPEVSLENRIMREVYELTGVQGTLSAIGVPIFSGTAATLQVNTTRRIAEKDLYAFFEKAGLKIKDKHASPRSIEGKPFVYVSRLQPNAHGFSLWLVMDNVRVAAQAGVQIARILSKES